MHQYRTQDSPNDKISQWNPQLSSMGFSNQLLRFLWTMVWAILARPLPRSLGRRWKVFLLRSFGAKIHSTAMIYSSASIYMPWNLTMHEYSCLGPRVDCYNVDSITLDPYSTVSQKAYLCSASHDISSIKMPLITAPIKIGRHAWVAAETFIGMGVVIEEGAIVGARACVYKDVEAWTVVGGNPARVIKKRIITDGKYLTQELKSSDAIQN